MQKMHTHTHTVQTDRDAQTYTRQDGPTDATHLLHLNLQQEKEHTKNTHLATIIVTKTQTYHKHC